MGKGASMADICIADGSIQLEVEFIIAAYD